MHIFNCKKHFVKNKLQLSQEVLLLLHNKIVVCRAEKGWTQEELAKRVSVSGSVAKFSTWSYTLENRI
nr:hypothetical protein [Bacillus arachidis]